VLLAVVILIGVILIPILLRSGKSPAPPVEPVVEQESQQGQGETTTPPQPELPPEEEPVEETTPGALAILERTVQPGDTLAGIASRLGVSSEQLAASNRVLNPRILTVGEILRSPRDGILHLIKPRQTLTDISLTYAVTVDEIIAANGISDPGMIYAGDELIIPGATGSLWQNVIRLSKGAESRFIWPLFGEVVSPFGWRDHPITGIYHHHNGIDIDVSVGTMVHAAAPGKVYFCGEEGGYGTLIVLEHSEGYYSFYGHLSETSVRRGQFVEMGQPIARSGNTGLSSGPHLHFEVRYDDFSLDPLRYLP
jgi:murein DD-endopeptidase MepM/ murein hydrolase activator NlpD